MTETETFEKSENTVTNTIKQTNIPVTASQSLQLTEVATHPQPPPRPVIRGPSEDIFRETEITTVKTLSFQYSKCQVAIVSFWLGLISF